MANPGLRRERVTFQYFSGPSDGQGGNAIGWTDFATNPTIWARVEPAGGRESLVGDQIEATVDYRVTIRYRADLADPRLAATYRLLWRGIPMNIRAVTNPDEHRMYLELGCELGAAT